MKSYATVSINRGALWRVPVDDVDPDFLLYFGVDLADCRYWCQKTPVVLLSGVGCSSNRLNIDGVGRVGFVVRPVQLDRMLIL